MAFYRDSETGETFTYEQLEKEFNEMQAEEKNNRTFPQYLNDCLGGNGFLERV